MPPKRRGASLTGQKERKSATERKQRSRSLQETREAEQVRDTIAHRTRRQTVSLREEERARDARKRAEARQDEDVRGSERARDARRRAEVRQDEDVRGSERARDARRRAEVRQDEDVRGSERARDARKRAEVRQNEDVRELERVSDARRRAEVRQDEEIRAPERAQNTRRMATVRQNEDIRELERASDAQRRAEVRQDEEIRAPEREQNTRRMATVRQNEAVRAPERIADASRRRTSRKEKKPWNEAFDLFQRKIREGPTYICTSCDCLFFYNQMIRKTRNEIKKHAKTDDYLEKLILDEYIEDESFLLCSTCNTSVRKGLFPRLNIKNSWLEFPKIPEVLKKLTPLEERCVALRIGFMKLKALGCDRQYGLTSGLVNVPADVRRTLTTIPALPNFSGTVELEFMRSMKFKSFMWKERVRPSLLYDAAVELEQTPLYIGEGVSINPQWNANENSAITIEFDPSKHSSGQTAIAELSDQEMKEYNEMQQYIRNHPEEFNDDIEQLMYVTDNEGNRRELTQEEREQFDRRLSSVEREELQAIRAENAGYIGEETLLDCAYGIRFAPGEGQTPIPLLMDDHCEEMMFPSIWAGYPRYPNPAIKPKIKMEDWNKSELRRSDRRCVRPEVVFVKYKMVQIKQLLSQTNMMFRRTAQGMNITANQALDRDFMQTQVLDDNIYRFASSITASPAYFEKVKKDVLAMIRQLDCPTIFLTMSAAETHWNELLVILKQVLDKEEITENEAANLTFDEKARLIRNDPVTCALYFNHRFRKVINLWKTTIDGPFDKYEIEDMFFRIEFQHRGSPHVHMIIWLKGAPRINPEALSDPDFTSETTQTVLNFIDDYITTDTDDPEVKDIIYCQCHKCRKQCKRFIRGKEVCRFGYPLPPMDRTRLLHPVPDSARKNMDKETRLKYDNLALSLFKILSEEHETIGSFDNLLQKLSCTLDEYLFLIRLSLKTHAKIFLKRLPKNAWVNGYNKKTLLAMKSNIDVQYIIDPYACVGYVVDYINKANRGLSRLLRQVVEDFNKGNHSLREKLKAVSNVMFNSTEISAQEAVWVRLQLPMTSTSVAVEFIHSGPLKSRHKMLKTNEELRDIAEKNPQSTDILKKGPIDRYPLRPDELEGTCLAQFIANFTFLSNKKEAGDEITTEELADFDAEDDENIHQKLKIYSLKEDSGKIQERRRSKVIRYCRFDIHQNPTQYYREMCQLFLPWRVEPDENTMDCEELYKNNIELIQNNFNLFNKIKIDLNDIYNQVYNDREHEENEIEVDIQNQERAHEEEEEEQRVIDNVFDFDENLIQPSAAHEMGMEVYGIDEVKRYKVPALMDKEETEILCNSLNFRQHVYLINMLSLFKSKATPFYHYIAGGAGVGKSMLINCIFQLITRYFRNLETGPADSIEVLLVAYTGAAAHNIGGMTAHSAFHLSTTEGTTKFKNLTDDARNTLRARLRFLRLVIIDEISMLSSDHIMEIDQRLREIHAPHLPFGGISVVTVGDFHQLRPVGAHYVFQDTIKKSSLRNVVGNTVWQLFKIFELTEIMRQKDDVPFSQMLVRVSEYKQTPDDVKMLESRMFTEETLPPEANDAFYLVPAQKDIREHNKKCLAKMILPDGSKPKQFKYIAKDILIGANLTKPTKDAAFHALEEFAEKFDNRSTKNLPKELDFMIGIRYMVSVNIDVTDGLYNGARGYLRFIEPGQDIMGRQTIKAVWLEFEKPDIGQIARENRKAFVELNKEKIKPNWTPISPRKETFNVTKKRTKVCREQFPLLMAEACTYHKSQGLSLPLSVQLQKSTTKMAMTLQLFYVGISRSPSLNGLFILGEKPLRIPRPSEDALTAINELSRMRRDCQLQLKFADIINDDHPNYIQITSFNIQSLRKHVDILKCDAVLRASNIILLQETWLHANEDFDVHDMLEIVRNKVAGRGRGTLIYARANLAPLSAVKASENVFGSNRIEVTSCSINDLFIINIYRSVDQTLHPANLIKALKPFEDYLHKPDILICGDFNFSMDEPSDMDNFFHDNYQLKLLSPRAPTTDNGTTIDAIFGRLTNYTHKSFIYESYVSYHKPLIIQVKKIN